MGWPLRRESMDIRSGWFHNLSAKLSGPFWNWICQSCCFLHGKGILPVWHECMQFRDQAIHCMAWSRNCMHSCILERISTTVSGKDDLTLLIRLCSTIHDNSMSEDFIGKVARQSRRVAFKNIVKTIINAYQVKAKIVIDKFQKRHRQPRAEKKHRQRHAWD